MKLRKLNKKGFTLMEMIVVIVIIGLLVGVTVPSVVKYIATAKDQTAKLETRNGLLQTDLNTADTAIGELPD